MKCKHTATLSDVGWCRIACMYCTSTQETSCKQKSAAQTNADYIRSMSDEELARFILEMCDGGEWYAPPTILDWLRQPKEQT